MGVGVGHAVGHRQLLKPKARLALVVLGPLYPLRTQGIAGPQHVEDVPAGVAVLPAVGIGVVEVAIEGVAGHLVIEADAVVAQHAGVRGGELLVNLANEVRLAQPVLHRLLRRDAGDEAGFRLRQVVRRRLAIDHQRLADDVEIGVGANARKLRRPVPGGADAEGLVVMKVESGLAAGLCCFAHVARGEVSDGGAMAPGWAVPCTAVASMVNHSAGRAKPGRPGCRFIERSKGAAQGAVQDCGWMGAYRTVPGGRGIRVCRSSRVKKPPSSGYQPPVSM